MDPDQVRVRHMLDAAQDALTFAAARSREELDSNRMFALALVQCIQIIGEAATQVSESYRSRHTDIPWHEIIGMRHRLVHSYYDIDLDIVWNTVMEGLPPLVAALGKAVHETS